ncbi:hypothetical protein [Phytoactinopolyspora halotolerans]|uniref:RNA polymerase sigma-70 region 4 domain-containing protein n=1 Tax=Phytoactinopolyspora halotolerans TaxID=1981512 RepID=A0A6L9SFF8_9ACTN|nr:hypothetical protein [Phytoactinopolyspora halotolerans]NEE03849.1 hypothetical protein [Phytoactinopolyspora halotolerans]
MTETDVDGTALVSGDEQARRVFTCTPERDGDHWLVRCDQYPGVCTRTRALAQAIDNQRRSLAAILDVPPEHIAVELRPRLPGDAAEHVSRARELRSTAAWANHAAAQEIRAAARILAEAELSLRDIGTILGISYQRAHQLVHNRKALHKRRRC